MARYRFNLISFSRISQDLPVRAPKQYSTGAKMLLRRAHYGAARQEHRERVPRSVATQAAVHAHSRLGAPRREGNGCEVERATASKTRFPQYEHTSLDYTTRPYYAVYNAT